MFEQIIKIFFSYIAAGMPCIFHIVTGYYCPGCGGTRAAAALLHGHIIQSFIYHPLVLYAIGAGVFLLCGKLLSVRAGRRYELPVVPAAVVGLIIIIINFIVKNVMLYFGIDLLEPLYF